MNRDFNKQSALLMLLLPFVTLFACTASPTIPPPTAPAATLAVPATAVPPATSLPIPSATAQPTIAAETSVSQAESVTPPSASTATVKVTAAAPTYTAVPGSPTTPPETIVVQATVVFGSGDFVLPDPAVGLADLSSYKATLTVAFDGTSDGKPQKWSETFVMLFSKAPAFRQLTITKSGDVTDPSPIYQAEQEGVSYKVGADKQCSATELQAGYSLGDQSEPASFITGVIGADAAGSATVNGVESKHYTFDERALGESAATLSSGELWVTANGGYVVKYLLTTQGKEDYFGKGVEGTLTLDYELSDVGKPAKLQLPTDCPAGMVNVPTLPDASNIDQAPGSLSFDSTTKLTAAIAFYQKRLPGLGWKAQDEPIVTDTSASLDYAQANQELSVFINTDAGKTSVNIVLQRATQ